MTTLADQKVRKRGEQYRREMMFLAAFGPETYGLEIPDMIAKPLLRKGLIEWVPPKFGTTLYQITVAGRALIGR